VQALDSEINGTMVLPLKTSHIHTQPFYGSLDFVRDNLGEPVPEEAWQWIKKGTGQTG